LITPVDLNKRTRKDLEQMAKRHGISGWHEMRKEQLVRALKRRAAKVNTANQTRASSTNGAKASNGSKTSNGAKATNGSKATNGAKAVGGVKTSQGTKTARGGKATARSDLKRSKAGKAVSAGKKSTAGKTGGGSKTNNGSARTKSPRISRKIKLVHEERERLRDLATESAGPVGQADNGGENVRRRARKRVRRDRLVLMVRDSYWLHAYWEVSRSTVERVQAAMNEFWHTAKPVLRLLEVAAGSTTNTSERVVREVHVHGGVNNWYLDVNDPPKSFRVDLGYLAANGRFHSVARSNSVTTPRPGANDALDQNWNDVAKNFEKVYAMSGGYDEAQDCGDLKELFEERLNCSMDSPLSNRYGVGADSASGHRENFTLDVDAELIVFGRTKPDAHVSLAGQPVRVREDGSFLVRKGMPDRRQVLPVVAGSRDGMEQRTVILAIERNTKVMEPLTRDTVG
jgi:uncharacterized protein